MGLIAREIEGRGVPTVCLTSALSITRAVNPPRAVFLDFPLGHTAGRPHEPQLQRAIVREAVGAFEALDEPGTVVRLPHAWSDDDAWKDAAMRPRTPQQATGTAERVDDRTQRTATPQYQTEEDRVRAEQALARDGCPTCVFPDRSQ